MAKRGDSMKNLTIEDKILNAFWSPTRQQFLPLVVEDVVNRSGVTKGKVVPALQMLVRRSKLAYETLPGGRQCYTAKEANK